MLLSFATKLSRESRLFLVINQCDLTLGFPILVKGCHTEDSDMGELQNFILFNPLNPFCALGCVQHNY